MAVRASFFPTQINDISNIFILYNAIKNSYFNTFLIRLGYVGDISAARRISRHTDVDDWKVQHNYDISLAAKAPASSMGFELPMIPYRSEKVSPRYKFYNVISIAITLN